MFFSCLGKGKKLCCLKTAVFLWWKACISTRWHGTVIEINQGVNHSQKSFVTYCGICPERALCTVLAGSPGRPGVLAEVVVPVNGSPAEVAHLSTATAGHAVATLRFN